MAKGDNTYSLSSGERVKKSVIDTRVHKAKALKIEQMKDEYGYIFCEDCGKNRNAGLPIDCSHNVSVDECQKQGKSELAYDVDNITMRCRICHQKHDKLC